MWHCAAVVSLTFLGAARTVTGSRHLLTTASGKRILIDAGLFQGRKDLRLRNWEPWRAGKLDAVILTHAHIDHTGFLPRLCAQAWWDGSCARRRRASSPGCCSPTA